MTRLAFGLAAWAALAGGASAAQDRPRLNVLLIVGDDLNTSLGCYGDARVKTPHFDRLARAGVRFDRAYCQYPLCNPSRSSFLSGVRPGGSLKDRVWISDFFRKHGYFTAEIGKAGHGFGPTTAMTWDLKDQNPKPSGAEAPPGAGKVCRRLLEVLEEKRDKPFFIGAGFNETHSGVWFPGSYVSLYAPDSIAWPEEPAEHLQDIPEIAHVKEHYDGTVTDAERRKRMAVYFGAVSYIDSQVGILLDALDRMKLRDRTVVVLTSDHGKHLGEHGGFWGKMSLYEPAARVPLLVAAPGRKAGAASPRVVELLDLYPTLAELCGLPAPRGVDGTSLVPLLEDPGGPWKKPAFTVTPREKGWGRSVRTERYRYTEWPDGSAQLFDHDNDPGECRNRAGDPAWAEVRAELKRLLRGARSPDKGPDGEDKER